MMFNCPVARVRFLIACVFGMAVFFASVPRAEACHCNCYYSSECSSGQHCEYNSCIRQGKLDGQCKGGGFGPSDWQYAALALEHWLFAYEIAGQNGGGPPDPTRVAAAQSVPNLTDAQRERVRDMAIAVQAAYLGLTNYPPAEQHLPGSFTPPVVLEGASCTNPMPPSPGDPNNGMVNPLSSNLLAVGSLIRQALVGELRNPGQGQFQSYMNQIPSANPSYLTYGRCEYPHPVSHGHDFPFANGLACLNSELGRAVQSVLGAPTAVPSTTDLSPIVLSALLLAAGTSMIALRRLAARQTR